jgi:hypothetical protein
MKILKTNWRAGATQELTVSETITDLVERHYDAYSSDATITTNMIEELTKFVSNLYQILYDEKILSVDHIKKLIENRANYEIKKEDE